MEDTIQKPAFRLAGICKKCHKFRFGYLLYGAGPFICYRCAEEAAKKIPTAPGTTAPTGNWFFSFTTSNNTTSTWNEGLG